MSDEAEKLLDGAVQALQKGDPSTCISFASQALQFLTEGDRRVPEALSLRGTARMSSLPEAGLDDLRRAVALDPNEAQFQTAFGQALASIGQLDEAEAALFRAWQLSKGHVVVGGLLGRVLLQRGKAFEAVQLLGPLVQSGKAHTGTIRMLAEALFNSGDIYSARDVLHQLYGPAGPQSSADRLQLARIEMALRDYTSAEQHLATLLKEEPDHLAALMSSVRLMSWLDNQEKLNEFVTNLSFHANDRPEALSIIVDHSTDLPDEKLGDWVKLVTDASLFTEEVAVLGFSLALYFDNHKEFERAFRIASLTNERLAAQRMLVQTAERIEDAQSRVIRQLSNARRLYREVEPVQKTQDYPEMVYLLGAPRTGSSLLQSILAAPEGIMSVGERGALFPYLNDAMDRGIENGAFAQLVKDLARADNAGLARLGPMQTRYIDKTPHHLYVAGLLQKINPDAKFVQVFRDARDVALSMFLRPFSPYFPEATSLESLSANLRTRLDVHAFWNAEGLNIHPFSYEAFTQAPEEQGQRLFGLLDQVWHDDYLKPSSRPEAIPTFSSRQVRKAITARPVPHWKSYAEFAPEAFSQLESVSAAQNDVIATKVL